MLHYRIQRVTIDIVIRSIERYIHTKTRTCTTDGDDYGWLYVTDRAINL